MWAASSTIAGAVDPVLRWASDHRGLPHPSAIAEVYFAGQVEERIPGSKVQIVWAKSLYTVPQGVRALTQGNLEVPTGQFGKTSSVEPLANILLCAGHLSTYMAAVAVKGCMIGPADFTVKKMRSMGPAENPPLTALGANPQAMALGDVPPALQNGVIDGLLTALCIEIGSVIPPVDLNLFAVSGVTGLPVIQVILGSFPLCDTDTVVLIIVLLFPLLAL